MSNYYRGGGTGKSIMTRICHDFEEVSELFWNLRVKGGKRRRRRRSYHHPRELSASVSGLFVSRVLQLLLQKAAVCKDNKYLSCKWSSSSSRRTFIPLNVTITKRVRVFSYNRCFIPSKRPFVLPDDDVPLTNK